MPRPNVDLEFVDCSLHNSRLMCSPMALMTLMLYFAPFVSIINLTYGQNADLAGDGGAPWPTNLTSAGK